MSELLLITLFIVLIILLGCSYLLASFGVTTLFGAPYVGTSKETGMEMLRLAALQNGEVFVDLGSGSGTLLLLAVKEFGAKKAIGYEINPFLVWITRVRARMHGVHRQVEVRRANIFKTTFPKMDVLGLYLLSPAMERLLPLMKAQNMKNVRIVSRGFTFQNLQPVKEQKGKISKIYLYLLK